jgi:hypothetical protein
MKFILITILSLALFACKKEEGGEKISTGEKIDPQTPTTYCMKNKISEHPDYDLWIMANHSTLVICEWDEGDSTGENQWVNLYELDKEGRLTPFMKDIDGKDFRNGNAFLNVDVVKVNDKEVKIQKVFHGIHESKNHIISEMTVRCEGRSCDTSSEKCIPVVKEDLSDEGAVDALERIFAGKLASDANLEAQISAVVGYAFQGNKRAWEVLQNNNTISLKSKLPKTEEEVDPYTEGESIVQIFQDGKEVIQKLKQQGCIKIADK